MNRALGLTAFVAGLGVVAWIAAGYRGSHALALTMTLSIGAFYLMGAMELRRFQQATASLRAALALLGDAAPQLGQWLATVPATLQNPVRLRIEGERAGLPGPALTPYLVGLLVLLGMLGTFLGMVVTLNGAVMALESTTDLATIRAALAAPIKGLGLAFGTSVAGVAASAMLGLMSVLARRERLQVAQLLDARIATQLRGFSRAHQREQTLESLQLQARAVPALVETLQTMVARLDQQQDHLNQRLIADQERFHQHAQTAYGALAAAVDQSLMHSLSESARLAGATIQPVVEASMAHIVRETGAFQASMAAAVGQQLDGMGRRFETTVTAVADAWKGVLGQHARSSEALVADVRQSLVGFTEQFVQGTDALLVSVDERHAASERERAAALTAMERQTVQLHAALQADLAGSDRQRLDAWTGSLDAMAVSMRERLQQTGDLALAQQQQICQTLDQTARAIQTQARAHAQDTIAEMSRLITAASEAPRAAAEVVGALREQLSDSMVRDTAMLDERSRIMQTLGTLLDAVNRAATEQRHAIDTLVAASASMLERLAAQFGAQVAQESGKMEAVATQVTVSAVEMASMGEAFAAAVQLFGQSSQALSDQLQRIETALDAASTRSDEQLAYYVAQAREIVDLSISSQRQIVDDLQQLAIRQSAASSMAS